jgi:transcription elongation factor Elf1
VATIIRKTVEEYECPVCGKVTNSAASMCAHIINTSNRFEAHWEWMAAHDISLIDTVGTYKPLMDVVKKKVKHNKHEVEEHILTIKGQKPEEE